MLPEHTTDCAAGKSERVRAGCALHGLHILASVALMLTAGTGQAQDGPGAAAERMTRINQQFHLRAIHRTGILIPLYIYPADIHTNADYNRVMDLKRHYPQVPFWVIVNPASGPGKTVDANYTKAIDRLIGAGCIVLGYVSTDHGRQPLTTIRRELTTWRHLYPRVHGVFFDEMINDDTDEAAKHQAGLNAEARSMGFWPTVANPGTDTPDRYFHRDAADVIVIHESGELPTEEKLHGDYFGGYADHPPFSRGVLVYGQETFDPESVRMMALYSRWIYITQDTFAQDQPDHANPWDSVSVHLEALCKALSD